mgnify:CR=1 FL=1
MFFLNHPLFFGGILYIFDVFFEYTPLKKPIFFQKRVFKLLSLYHKMKLK